MTILPRSVFPALKAAMQDQRVIVLTGMRRVGKTTALRWLLEQVPSQNKIYLDLERLDQRKLFQENNYDLVLAFLRNRGLDPSRPMTVGLDEIQYVPNLPSVVKYLHDAYPIKFLMTGSSSYYLKNYFSESLAGRKIVFELYPLGFGEYLDFKGVPYRRRTELAEMLFEAYEFDRLKQYYDDFIQYGGLPDVVLENRPEVKREILNDVFTSYINIDVRSITDFRKLGELQQLIKLLVLRVGARVDVTKLSTIIGISRPTLMDYLEFLEKTYIIYRLPAAAGLDRAAALGRKLYFYDNGIANILAQPSDGALFENAVFNQLKNYGRLAYLSRGKDYEVDFILTDEIGALPRALEVKLHPVHADLTRLKRMVERQGMAQSWLVGRYPTPGFSQFIWGGLIF